MNTLKNLKLLLGSIIMMVVTTQISVAQTFSVNNTASNLIIEGSSNIHDWEIEAKDQQGKITVELNDGQLVKLTQLDFVVKAESLKSGKGGMDKNTYKALNTDKHKTITYKLTKLENIDCVTTGNCKVTTTGNLTIAGATKSLEIIFDAKITGDKIVLSGNKSIKMTDFKVDPPTAMFGTITTGDEVTIQFQTVFNK
ncbi:MAG: YceI family protein [Gillisia sp.]